MTIAKLHKFSRKFVGWITAVGPIVALAVSVLTIVAGVIIYATKIWPDSWPYWVGAGVIGILFSLLVERLTLTQAAKVRTIREKKEAIETAYAELKDPTKTSLEHKERELDEAGKGTFGAWGLMLFGAIVSTCAGTLFWHYLLQALPDWPAWGFLTLFSANLSFTPCSNSIPPRLYHDVISFIIIAGQF